MSEQNPYYQIPPQDPDLPEDLEDFSFLSVPNVCQGPPHPFGVGLFSTVPLADDGHCDCYHPQHSVQWPANREQQDTSDLCSIRNTYVRNGQLTPPPYNDDNEQLSQLAFSSFHTLAHHQMEGFQDMNAPFPCQPSVPLAPVAYSDEVKQTPSLEHSHSTSSSSGRSLPARRPRSHASVDDTKSKVKKAKGAHSELLERNRQAAKKCREKKKALVKELNAMCLQQEAINKDLKLQLAQLNNNRLHLKNLLFPHASCGNRPIDAFWQKEIDIATRQPISSSVPSPGSTVTDFFSPCTPDTADFGFDGFTSR